jgi:hypothetical protein
LRQIILRRTGLGRDDRKNDTVAGAPVERNAHWRRGFSGTSFKHTRVAGRGHIADSAAVGRDPKYTQLTLQAFGGDSDVDGLVTEP